jgi:hypothetical protein
MFQVRVHGRPGLNTETALFEGRRCPDNAVIKLGPSAPYEMEPEAI